VRLPVRLDDNVFLATATSAFLSFCHILIEACDQSGNGCGLETLIISKHLTAGPNQSKVHLLSWCLLLAGDGLLLAFTSSRIRLRTLAAYRQTTTMAQTPVATNIHQSLYVELNLGPKLTFHPILILNHATDRPSLFVTPPIRGHIGVQSYFVKDLSRKRPTDTVDRGKRNFTALVIWNVYSRNSWHTRIRN